MTQRTRFVVDCQRGLFSVTELCHHYGISRKTAYKWLARFLDEGPSGLVDRSRAPLFCPHKTPAHVADSLLEVRHRHPHWGPKKLLTLLERKQPHWPWPAPSTASEILKRHGLVSSPRRTRRPGHPGRPDTPMTHPNDIWTIDFKGHFKTQDGRYCYPLTVADGFSRFLLGCQALLSPSLSGTKKTLTQLFRDYGLPTIIRSDNGTPFATCALGRLSRLSVWWIRLGIYPELIEPGHPEQNPRHERMHRTLKSDTTIPPAATIAAQQRRFNLFRTTFNEERPHEALGQKTPGSFYVPSPRTFPQRLPLLDYPGHFEVRKVSNNGGIRWNSRWVNISHALAQEFVGLEEVDNNLWNLYFGPLWLGRLLEKDLRIEDALGRKRRRKVLPMYPD